MLMCLEQVQGKKKGPALIDCIEKVQVSIGVDELIQSK